MNTTIREHLTFLYGEPSGPELAARLETIIGQFHPRGGTPPAADGGTLSERDSLLITYGDQVREPGVAPLLTLGAFAEKHLRGVVSGIHLLPFYPWTSDDGFSVQDYFAVDPALGGWEEIRRLGGSFDLMFDAVVNHMSAQSAWFRRFLAADPAFRDFFVTVTGNPDLSKVIRPRALPLITEFPGAGGVQKVWTTFSADQVDLNFKNPEVLLAVIGALLFYVANGARFLRLDAIAFLWKEPGTTCLHLPQTHRIIRLMRAVFGEVAPHVRLITETNVPHADNVSYFGDGTNEAQLVYNFALPPLVLHSLATGDAAQLTRWAQTLTLPSEDVAFFNFLSSHDGIGLNPARGLLSDEEIAALVTRAQAHGGLVSHKHNPDGSKSPYELNVNYFDALSDPAAGEPRETQVARFLAAHAIMLSLRGMPGIYFHSLFGSRGDRAGAETSGMPRRINREKLDRTALERELADPDSLRAAVFTALSRLLTLRQAEPSFSPAAGQTLLEPDRRVFALLRIAPGGGRWALCLHNVSAETVAVAGALPGVPQETQWRSLLAAGDAGVKADAYAVRLAPYQCAWFSGTAG